MSVAAHKPWLLRWRIVFYLPALAFALLALVVAQPRVREVAFVAFAVAMILPLLIKALAGGWLPRFGSWLVRRRLRLTREGWAFFVLTIAFGVAAINTGTNLLYLVLALLLSMIVVSGVLSERCVRGLRIGRQLPLAVFADQPAQMTFVVHNARKLMPAFVIEIGERSGPFGDDGGAASGEFCFLGRLDPGKRAALSYSHRFARRGVSKLVGLELRTRFPFALFTKYVRERLHGELVVFPQVRTLAPSVTARMQAEARRSSCAQPNRTGDAFRSLRPYQAGDAKRSIHWRSSARWGHLMVKEFDHMQGGRVAIVVDLDVGTPLSDVRPCAADRLLDRVTTLAASLAGFSVARGDVPHVLPKRQGHGVERRDRGSEFLQTLDRLARFEPVADPAFSQLQMAIRSAGQQASTVFVVSARSEADVAAVCALASRRVSHVLCVADEQAFESCFEHVEASELSYEA